jgi:peptidoglycan/LPS O-acetylase OafA/YrhL
MKLTYRADIDGLRAIAVLSVVFNHAGIRLFPGGFIGVDVFFVISGYLITGIIMREINAGEFSLAKFYERRIRRIYPALFVTVFFTMFAAAILYRADNFRDMSKSAIATTFFISNIHFWSETGYFEGPAQLKPLLHTWSLAVEEQYYIFFPLCMLFLARYFKSKIFPILIGVALLSFGWNIYTLQIDSSAAFYLAHLRAWELLIGSLLALNPVATQTQPATRNLLGVIGLGMITLPVFLYSATTSFPGFAAAVPALGAALIIYSGIENSVFVNKLLGFSPLVFVGKISYSLYLWHWVLIVFGKYYAIKKMTSSEIIGLTLAIFFISALSWRFVEKPFREKRALKNRNVFIYAGGVMALTAAIGALVYYNDGFQKLWTIKDEPKRTWGISCDYGKPSYKDADLPKGCPLGVRKQNPSFLLWGDSSARVLAEGVWVSAAKRNLKGLLVFSSGCAPVLGVQRDDLLWCVDSNNAIIKYIEQHPELETIILASRWASWIEGSDYNFTEEKKNIVLTDTLSVSAKNETNAVLFERGLERTLQKLFKLNRKVVIVSQTPEIGYDVPSVNFIAQRTGRDANAIIAPALDEFLQRNRNVALVLNAIAKKYNLQILDPWKVLCNAAQCLTVANGRSLYADDYHLSIFGSEYISRIYDSLFEELASQSK